MTGSNARSARDQPIYRLRDARNLPLEPAQGVFNEAQPLIHFLLMLRGLSLVGGLLGAAIAMIAALSLPSQKPLPIPPPKGTSKPKWVARAHNESRRDHASTP